MALPNGISSSEELLEAQTHVWNQMYSFINSMSLKCAIQLGIPDAIHKHGKPMTLSQLADALTINGPKTDSLRRLMWVLVHSKFFHKAKTEEVYSLTRASRLMLEDEPLSAVPQVRAMLDPNLTEPWHDLSQWFRNDSDTAFSAHHGRSVWEYVAADEGLNVILNKSLACDAGFVASVLTNECMLVNGH